MRKLKIPGVVSKKYVLNPRLDYFWKSPILLAKTWDMRQEHTTIILPFRIKLKKGYTKNACTHLCSIAEVAKPSNKMTLWYWKIATMAGASKITSTLLWQFFNTNKFKKNMYCLSLYSTTFQDHFKIGRALPQLHKNYETFYSLNTRWPDGSFNTEKSQLRYGATKIHLGQSEVPVER